MRVGTRLPSRSTTGSWRSHIHDWRRPLGIRNRLARNGAILAVVGEIHWKVLGDLLGISDSAAQRWHNAGGGDRASYVASRLRQQTPQSPLEESTRH